MVVFPHPVEIFVKMDSSSPSGEPKEWFETTEQKPLTFEKVKFPSNYHSPKTGSETTPEKSGLEDEGHFPFFWGGFGLFSRAMLILGRVILKHTFPEINSSSAPEK